jgi:hypothetical protein
MARAIDPRKLKPQPRSIPGLKPPVFSFSPQDKDAPEEAQEFHAFIRKLRRESIADTSMQ